MSEKEKKKEKHDNQAIQEEENGFLFSIEVLIKGKTNGHALEALTHLLNKEQVTDYRIIKGINLGQIIAENSKHAKEKHTSIKLSAVTEPQSHHNTAEKEIKGATKTEITSPKSKTEILQHLLPIIQQIEQFKEQRSLIRLTINKGKGIKLNIPCRILNFDLASGNITAYHVDEKKVYSIDLNEIDDLVSW